MKVPAALIVVVLAACDLGAETNFQFRASLLEVHPRRIAANAEVVALDDNPVVKHAAEDFRDFLCGPGKGDERRWKVTVGVRPEADKLTSRITVGEGVVEVSGATPKEAFQGVCRLEDELLAAGGFAALHIGSRTYTRMFSPRMTHSGYEVETFPNAYLDRLAHSGMDAILVFIEDPPDVTRNGRVDMNALVKRCEERGIDVWAYASFPEKASKFHPLDPGAEEWYDATYGAIVKNCPKIKGLICVGESCGFPSRDPGMGGYWWEKDWAKKGTKLNGFWPVSDWPEWLDLVKKVTRRYQPDFEVVFWTYNWFKKPAEIRLPLLENIPTDLTLLVTWVRGDKPQLKCGVPTFITDYSVTGPGPSAVFRSEADIAVRRGIPVMTISNTGGRTWDSGCAPYVPVPGRWRARFESLRKGQREWGLKALMESHHYGFQPSFISDLAKVAFTRETTEADYERAYRSIVAREFGERATEAAMKAFEKWDAAFAYHQTGDRDFWGPLRVGPAYPFHRPGEKLPPPCRIEGGRTDGVNGGAGWKYMLASFSCPTNEITGNVELARREIALMQEGVDLLSAAMAEVPAEKLAGARRILGVGEFFMRSVITLRNVYRYYGAALAKDAPAMRAIAAEERENVLRTIPLVEADSSLGWEATMGYVCDRTALEHKLKQLSALK